MNRIAATSLARPMARAVIVRPAAFTSLRHYTSPAEAEGKSKLRFRFGLRDVPVELYPMAFVVGMAVLGAGIATARHFSVDDLRLKPNEKVAKE